MAPLHLQGGEVVALVVSESFPAGQAEAARASAAACLGQDSPTRSRVVVFDGKGNELLVVLDFSSLGCFGSNKLQNIQNILFFFFSFSLLSYAMHLTVFLTGV